MIDLRSRSSAVVAWMSLMVADRVLMFSSEKTRLTRSRTSTVRWMMKPPPARRSESASRLLFILGTTPLGTVLLSRGKVAVPAVICT